jgi:Zn-dependent protease with chaperone function
MFAWLGICLALAALLAINAGASLVTTALWRALQRPARSWSALSRARLLFALRILPAACALFGVMALLSPAYLTHEPRSTTETVTLKLAVISFFSMLGILLALWRGISAWRATRALVADWMREAEPVTLENIPIPVYRIRHPFPVIAIVGATRPRLFIASQIFSTLNKEEIAAALAHELGHLTARDNLKRVLVRACSDVLTIVPAGRSLDRAWTASAEGAADEFVARTQGAQRALDLASALVKIARLAPLGAKPTMPAGAFLMGDDASGLAWRIRHLTQLASVEANRKDEPLLLRFACWLCLGALLACALFAATNSHVLLTMHQFMEEIVKALQ